MTMKLSYRDKVIAIILVVLVILGVGIFCFAKPKYQELQDSKFRLEQKQQEWAQVEEKMGTLDGLKEKLKTDVKSVEETQKKFLDEREYGLEYQVSEYLMEKLTDIEDFNIVGVNMDLLEGEDIQAFFYNKRAVAYPMKINADIAGKLAEEKPEVFYAYNKSYPQAPASTQICTSIVRISYECDDSETLFEAIQKIADNDKNIYLMTCSGEYNFDVNEVGEGKAKYEGDMTIAVYEVYPLDPNDVEA